MAYSVPTLQLPVLLLISQHDICDIGPLSFQRHETSFFVGDSRWEDFGPGLLICSLEGCILVNQQVVQWSSTAMDDSGRHRQHKTDLTDFLRTTKFMVAWLHTLTRLLGVATVEWVCTLNSLEASCFSNPLGLLLNLA